jgi:hypothetical protein
MDHATRLKPLFHPGRLLITPEAHHTLRLTGVPVISVILRHIAGDWGIVSDDDKRQNDLSIVAGLRLLSVYRLPDDSRLIVVTEWDRSSTTIELLGQTSARSGTCYPQSPITSFAPEGRA